MDDKHQKMMDKLAGMSGTNFDKEYLDGQVTDHKSDRRIRRAAKDGKAPTLKQFVAETLPTLRAHLKMAQDLQKKIS